MKNIIAQLLFLFLIIVTFCGCASTDQQITKLRNENKMLAVELAKSNTAISKLKDDKAFLEKETYYYSTRSTVLENERNTRISSNMELRRGVRSFTDNMIKSLQSYYKKTEIVDSIGSEVFKRSTIGVEKRSLLIDFAHPLPKDGTLTGCNVYLAKSGKLNFCLLRADKKTSDRYNLIQVSNLFHSDSHGVQTWPFSPPIAAQKGDLIAIYCPEDVIIPYDPVDTGNVILVKTKTVEKRKYITAKTNNKRGKRAYSFAVTGFMY